MKDHHRREYLDMNTFHFKNSINTNKKGLVKILRSFNKVFRFNNKNTTFINKIILFLIEHK